MEKSKIKKIIIIFKNTVIIKTLPVEFDFPTISV